MLSVYTACLDMTRVRSSAFLGSHHTGHVCMEHQESRDPEGGPQPGYLAQNMAAEPTSAQTMAKPSPASSGAPCVRSVYGCWLVCPWQY